MSSTNIPLSKKAWEGLKGLNRDNWKKWGKCGQIYLKEIQAWHVISGIKSVPVQEMGESILDFKEWEMKFESMQVKGLAAICEIVGLEAISTIPLENLDPKVVWDLLQKNFENKTTSEHDLE